MARSPHSPQALTRRPRRTFTQLSPDFDWSAIDDEIATLATSGGIQDASRRTYDSAWQRWKSHCEALGTDPHDAPFTAYEALLAPQQATGCVYAAATLSQTLAEVTRRYRAAGRTPAHLHPDNSGAWSSARRGFILDEADRRQDGDPPQAEVVPLTRDHLLAMLDASGARTEERRTNAVRVAAALLSFETGLANHRLASLRCADVTAAADGAISLLGHVVACDHTERFRGVPWNCAACSTRRTLLTAPHTDGSTIRRPPDELLFAPLHTAGAAAAPGQVKDAFATLIRGFTRRGVPGLPARAAGTRKPASLRPVADLSVWELAGLRRAIVLHVGLQHGLHLVRARFWTAMSWSFALRMSSDLIGLDRARFHHDVRGRGWTVHLAGTKDDRDGHKNVTRPLAWAEHPGGHGLGELASEYFAVRDALAGPTGNALLSGLTFATPRPIPPGQAGLHLAARDLDLLCAIAGLGIEFSSYSTRKGFVAQADADRWPPERIAAALRHADMDTLAAYLPARDAREAADQFILALVTASGAQQAPDRIKKGWAA